LRRREEKRRKRTERTVFKEGKGKGVEREQNLGGGKEGLRDENELKPQTEKPKVMSPDLTAARKRVGKVDMGKESGKKDSLLKKEERSKS